MVRMMSLNQPRDRIRMVRIGLAMGGKELDACIVFHAVETAQAVDFCGGDFGNLRLVNIKRGESRGRSRLK